MGSHPASRSPLGVDDLLGNAFEWVRSAEGGCVNRGGAYYFDADMSGRIDNRTEQEATIRDPTQGMRLCATWPPPARHRGNSDARRAGEPRP